LVAKQRRFDCRGIRSVPYGFAQGDRSLTPHATYLPPPRRIFTIRSMLSHSCRPSTPAANAPQAIASA